MINILGGVMLGLLGGYILFHRELRSRYLLLAMICIWFFIILGLYFPRLALLPVLYLESLKF